MTEKTPKQLLWDWLKAEKRHHARKGKPVAEPTALEQKLFGLPAAIDKATEGLTAMAASAQDVADAVVAVAMGVK